MESEIFLRIGLKEGVEMRPSYSISPFVNITINSIAGKSVLRIVFS